MKTVHFPRDPSLLRLSTYLSILRLAAVSSNRLQDGGDHQPNGGQQAGAPEAGQQPHHKQVNIFAMNTG